MICKKTLPSTNATSSHISSEMLKSDIINLVREENVIYRTRVLATTCKFNEPKEKWAHTGFFMDLQEIWKDSKHEKLNNLNIL